MYAIFDMGLIYFDLFIIKHANVRKILNKNKIQVFTCRYGQVYSIEKFCNFLLICI